MLKAVFDTNVLVSGLVHAGKSRQLMDAVIEGKILLYTSVEIIEELRKVLARVKFKLSMNQQDLLVNFILRISNIVIVKSKFDVVEEDPSDDVVLRTAYDGKVDYIASGDQHLLALKEFAFCRYVEDDYYEWLKDNIKSFFNNGDPDWTWIIKKSRLVSKG